MTKDPGRMGGQGQAGNSGPEKMGQPLSRQEQDALRQLEAAKQLDVENVAMRRETDGMLRPAPLYVPTRCALPIVTVGTREMARPPNAQNNDRSFWRDSFSADDGFAFVEDDRGVLVIDTQSERVIRLPWPVIRHVVYSNELAQAVRGEGAVSG